MKKIPLNAPVSIRDVRVPNGKSFGFWRDAFVPPPLLRELAQRKSAWAVVERGPKGPFVARLEDQPEFRLEFDEEDFTRCEEFCLTTGQISYDPVPGFMDGKVSPAGVFRWMPIPRQNALRDKIEANTLRKAYAGLSDDQIVRAIKKYAREKYGRTGPDYVIGAAEAFLRAGFSVAERVMAENKAILEEREARFARERAEIEEQRAPFMDLAAKLNSQMAGMYGYDFKPYPPEIIADQLAGGKSPEQIVEEFKASAEEFLARSNGGGADTFGFAHGTDFAGGEW